MQQGRCGIVFLFCSYSLLSFFLVFFQEKFASSIKYFPEIVSISSRVLGAARLLDVPVVVTEQYPKGLGRTAAQLGLAEFPDIKPIEKTQFSMVTSDVLNLMKDKHPQVKSVILCGIEAHVCVQGTCLELLDKGYDVHVVADGVSSRTQIDRKFALDRMKRAGAFVTTSESVILGLVGDSAHPKFKEVQKLILQSAPDTGLLEF